MRQAKARRRETLADRIDRLETQLREHRARRAAIAKERAALAPRMLEGDTAAMVRDAGLAEEETALAESIRIAALALPELMAARDEAAASRRRRSVRAANTRITRLLSQRQAHVEALEAAADGIAEALDALDKVGAEIRRLRVRHLGTQAGGDHLSKGCLHGRLQRYLGRKLGRFAGLGFELRRDGTAPAPWSEWEATWTRDLLIPEATTDQNKETTA